MFQSRLLGLVGRSQVRIQDLVKGGAPASAAEIADVAKRSRASEASNIPGPA